MSKTWFVTGASRGIGAAIVKAALAAGDRVVATGRDPAKVAQAFEASPDKLLIAALDVAVETQAEAAVEAALERFGGVDVLVNNAGYGLLGPFEQSEPEQIGRQFATNVFGVFNVTRAVLPVMRRQRAGRIFNITSIGGLRGGPGGSLYSATKFAVEGFSESLALEVAEFGIKMTLVEPGFFRTDFLDESSIRYNDRPIADYAALSTRLKEFYGPRNHQQAGDPAKLAKVLVDLARHEKPPLRFVAGSDAAAMFETKIASVKAELEAWRALSVTTDGEF
ncbi:oxidoreductase [Methylocapsa sp. S129]|uniref:oxidoreductase n=1 Tax=Methylocapsa sp. S129 TaxID=1641869 RepID=UPI00131D3BFA|nr:oxidoreductase [Methylocapsa sp. S129]